MLLTEHHNENQLYVRKADRDAVSIVDREFRASIVLGATRVVDDFPVRSVRELNEAAIEQILRFQPEVVLLGTGARAIFPPPNVLVQFLERGIGLETMDNAAAARTFNVLIGEGRNAVAVFLLNDPEG